MQNNKIIALFMPSQTPFYTGLFSAIKKSLEHLSYKVVGGCKLLEGDELLSFINKNTPSIFFEMNRCKAEIKHFPKNILHITWIVDLWGRKLSDIQGSEIVYFFSTEWLKDYKSNSNCKVDWLPPASDPDYYFPINDTNKKCKSVFIGHISNPWKKNDLERIFLEKNNNKILFSDILDSFEKKWSVQDEIVNNDCYLKEVQDWIKKNYLINFEITDPVMRYDVGCRIIRKGRREFFLDTLLENVNILPLSIYGKKTWLKWDKYSEFYKKELMTPEEMNTVFNQSELVIHEGVGFHFRLFDAMLSGIPLLLRKSEQDNAWGGLSTYFCENEDYISIDINKTDTLKSINMSKERLEDISNNARRKVLMHHTWNHRLDKVVKDIHEFYQ